MKNNYHYFRGCESIEDAKQLYKKLALQYHPDRNKSADATKIMQQINAEFERFIKDYKVKDKDGKTKAESAKDYIDIIDALLELQGVEIELVGSWLWLHGSTFANKEKIKELGFRWSKGKKAWYHKGADNDNDKKPHRSEDWLKTRMRYGSEFITAKNKSRLQLAQ